MRLLIMFDLPTQTATNRRNYRKFRQMLINEGFLMLQESIYVRVCVNLTNVHLIENRLNMLSPKDGVINSLIITEKQFANMHFLAGEAIDDVRNTIDGLVII